MTVGIEARERLQDRRRDLEDKGDDAYLCEGEPKLVFQYGIDGRHNRLDHVVQEMAYTYYYKNGEHGSSRHRRVSLNLVA